MELNLNGKVVVVTGGSSGIGEETAMEFAREGCEVTIASRSEKKLAEAAGRFEVEGFQVHTQVVDVSKPEDISALGEKVFQQFGRIDVWINNAGGNITKPFLELTVEDWNFVISTNMTSVFWGTHVAVDYMRRTGGGVILNTSSYMALIPATQKIAYAATKAGIVNMTKTTAGELAPLGIRVNCVVPGLIQTPSVSLPTGKSCVPRLRYSASESPLMYLVFTPFWRPMLRHSSPAPQSRSAAESSVSRISALPGESRSDRGRQMVNLFLYHLLV